MEIIKKMDSISSYKDKIADLTKVSDVDHNISFEFGNLIISNPKEEHIPELAELWANLATIQQLNNPVRYCFKREDKNWQNVVRHKMSKSQNLLLVATTKDSPEVKGFLYLQTVTIPSSDLIIKGFIEDLYTKPQHRRKGIAHKMLEVAMCWSKLHGFKQIELVSLLNSKDVISFYESFKQLQEKEIDLELVKL